MPFFATAIRMMSFSADNMEKPCGQGFTEICRVVAGISGDSSDSMLTSLPSELCFNDLRDSGRRHSRAEKTCAHNVHAVAFKSSCVRNAGGDSITLADQDWAVPLPSKHLKARVHSTLKATDTELGLSSEGLTKHKSCKNYTKPHVFLQRLELLRTLCTVYAEEVRSELTSEEDRIDVILSVFNDLWTSKLVPEHAFVSWNAGEETSTRTLVLHAGPHALRVLPLVHFEDKVFTFKEMKVPRAQKIVGGLLDVKVALCEPCLAHDQLGWRQSSEWMNLPEYVADFSLLQTPRSLLAQICQKLGLKTTKMDYKSRVRCFLQHMNKTEDFIKDILDEIPDAQPRQRKRKHDGEAGIRSMQSMWCKDWILHVI